LVLNFLKLTEEQKKKWWRIWKNLKFQW
jgi:hypothetical protein